MCPIIVGSPEYQYQIRLPTRSGQLYGVESAHYQEHRGGQGKSLRRDALEDRRDTRSGVGIESKGGR